MSDAIECNMTCVLLAAIGDNCLAEWMNMAYDQLVYIEFIYEKCGKFLNFKMQTWVSTHGSSATRGNFISWYMDMMVQMVDDLEHDYNLCACRLGD